MSADSHSASQPDHDSSPVPSTRSRNRFWFSIAISMVLGGVGGFAVVRYLQSGGSILFLETLKFWEIIIYPFQWLATSKGIRFGWVTDIGQMGGLAVAAPTAVGPGIKRQLFSLRSQRFLFGFPMEGSQLIANWFPSSRFSAFF